MILVTGGAGFIGSNLCKTLLNMDKEIICIDNFNDFYDPQIKKRNTRESLKYKGYKLFEGDIRDKKFLKKIFENNKIDAVIHLAAMAGVRPSIQDPILYEDVNIKGTMNILEMCKNYNVRKVILASSSSVYGSNKKIPFSESDVVDFAISPYAATKKSCEVIGHVYHSLYNINMIVLRFFTVYGPGQRPDLAIHKFTRYIVEGREIPFFGDGSSKRDYTYVDDIVDGIVKSLKYIATNKGVYEIINLGESHTISLKEMVNTIEDTLGLKAKIRKLPNQLGDVNVTYADITKAKRLLGYNPQISFQEGISRFVNWFYAVTGKDK